MDYLANDRNLVRTAVLAALNIVPSNAVFRTDSAAKAGGGDVTLSGDYTGQQDATYDVRIDDDASATPTVTNPTFAGVGNGVMSNLAITGVAPQTISVTLEDRGTATTFAYAPFQGVTLTAKASGSGGNSIVLTIDQSALVSTPTDFALRENLEAAKNEYTGDRWNFGAATLTADGNVPASAPRVRFGDDPQVYRAYRYYRGGSYVYAFAPAPVRTVPKGARVKLVSGTRSITITNGASTDTLTGIVTLYDCLAAIRDSSTLVKFDGAAVNDLRPEGMGTVDLSVYTEPYIASIVRSGSDAVQESTFGITPDASAPSEILTLTCKSNARAGNESWKVRGDVSTMLADAITGVPYVDGAYRFTIPLPPAPVSGAGGTIRIEYRPQPRGEVDNTPALCVQQARLGALARNGSFLFKLQLRPPPPCDCSDAVSTGSPSDDCLGNTDGGTPVSITDDLRYRRIGVDRWYRRMYSLLRIVSAGDAPSDAVSIAVINASRNMVVDALKKVFDGVAGVPDTAWHASHTYEDGTIVAPIKRNGFLFRVADAGASGSSEPTWPEDIGETVVDGGVTWECFSRDAIGAWDDAFAEIKRRLAQEIVAPTSIWTASRAYDYGTGTPPPYTGPVVPTAANGHYYVLTDPGTSGASQPTWPTDGSTVADGGAVWQDAGTYWEVNTKVAAGEIIYAYNVGLFECTKSGTTDGAEPTWEGVTVTDGTVTWGRIETPSGTGNIYTSSNVGQLLKPLFAEAFTLAGSSANFNSAGTATDECWQDDPDAIWWWVYQGQDDPPYMPIFTGRYYHSAKLTVDENNNPIIHTTKEFGFDPRFGCADMLALDDELLIVIDGVAGGSNGYQVGDTISAEVTRIGPTEFGGGQTGDDTQTWNVSGTVGSFIPYSLVTTAIADYSNAGLTFRITPGGVPFELGDEFEFDVEGPQIRWRKNGGSWSAQIDLAATIALTDGLSAAFAPGSAPSWVIGDQWGFSAESVHGPEGLRQPTDARCTWTSSTTITITPVTPSAVTAVLLADHTIPSDAVIRLQGSDDNFATTPVNVLLTWRERHIYAKGAFGSRAKYRVTVDKGGSLQWLWLGDPFVPTIKTGAKELGKLTKQRRMPGLTTRSALGVKIEHTSLPQSAVDSLLAALEHACAYDDGRLAVIPNPDEAEVGLVRFVAGTLDFDDVLGFQPRDTAHRLQSATLTLEPCP